MEEDIKSKSQKKRDADALKKIGVELIELKQEQLNTLPLTDELRRAIAQAKTIKSHGAKRRQAQLIGKLMRAADSEAIMTAYEQMLDENKGQAISFHEAEQWRDKLMHEGPAALTEFIELYQPADIQQLRQLLKKAKDEQEKQINLGAYRALFRLIRSSLP